MRRPVIKSEHSPVRYGHDRVRIGGIVRGIAADIVDPDGWLWALLELLDGTRTTEQILVDLVRRRPGTTKSQVGEAIGDLVEAGYVVDADECGPVALTSAERERHSRSHALFRWMDRRPRHSTWDAQLLLRQARVVVIGVGGVGCSAALALVASGVGHVHCVEPDRVELSNLNRQILYVESDLGRPKVDVAVERLRAHNSGIDVTGEELVIDGPGALKALAVRFDVLVLAADHPREIRSWTSRACEATGTAWVHGGYHGPQVGTGLYRPGAGPCYDCARIAERERRAGRPPRTLPATTGDGTRPHAANAVSAGIAGYLAAHATMSLITGAPALRTNCEFGFNLVTLEDSFAVGPRAARPDCPTCG